MRAEEIHDRVQGNFVTRLLSVTAIEGRQSEPAVSFTEGNRHSY